MVLIFLAPGFEEIEALTPVDLLRRAGIEVTTLSLAESVVTGAHGIPVAADKVAEAVFLPPNYPEVEMLVLPGGPATAFLAGSAFVSKAVDWAVDKGIYVAAICAAPTILGGKGLLCGRKAISYPGTENALIDALITDKPVVIDGKFITAKAAGSALPFALELIRLLKGQEVADRVAASIHYA